MHTRSKKTPIPYINRSRYLGRYSYSNAKPTGGVLSASYDELASLVHATTAACMLPPTLSLGFLVVFLSFFPFLFVFLVCHFLSWSRIVSGKASSFSYYLFSFRNMGKEVFFFFFRSLVSCTIQLRLELALSLLNMLNKIGNGADLQSPLSRKGNVGLAPHHAGAGDDGLAGGRLAVLDELGDGGGRVLAGQAAELDGGLGVADALADAAGGSAQGQDVAGADEARRGGLGVGQEAAAEGAVVGADARGDGVVGGVDGDGVGGAAGVLAGRDHDGQLQGVGARGHDGGADEAGGVAHHPGHLLGGDVLGGDDQVGLILAAGVVEHQDEFASACLRAGSVSKDWSGRRRAWLG